MLTCIYLCRTLLFFAPYADFYRKHDPFTIVKSGSFIIYHLYLVRKQFSLHFEFGTFIFT